MANSRGIRAGRAFVELGVSDRLTAGLRRAQRRLQAFGAGVRQIGLRLVTAGAAAAAPIGAMVGLFVRAGSALDDLSQRTGVSVESLSELGFAAERSGSSIESLGGALFRMRRRVANAATGSGAAVRALTALGLRATDLTNLGVEDQFLAIVAALGRVENASLKAQLAFEIFGDGARDLLPLLNSGVNGIAALRAEARRLGVTMSTEAAQEAGRLGNAVVSLRAAVRATAIALGGALAPTLEAITKRLTRIAVVTGDWIKRNRALIVTAVKIAAGLIAIGSALVALGLLLSLIGGAFGGLAAIITGVGAAIGLVTTALGALLSPIGLVVAAVVGAGVAFLRFSGAGSAALDFLRERFALLSGVVGKTIGGIRDALAAGDIPLAARVLWAGLQLVWLEGTKEIRKTLAEGLLVMRLAFVETLATMSRLWTRFSSGLRSVWEKTQNFLAKRFTELFGLFDDSLDVEAAKASLDSQSQAALESLARETEDALQRISEEQDARSKGLLDDAAEKMEERRKALEDARRDLDEAIDEARRRREATDEGDAATPSVADRIREIEESLDSVSDGIARRVEVRGTFNALAAQGLTSGTDAIDRTARASEQTARNTRRLVEASQRGTLTFA